MNQQDQGTKTSKNIVLVKPAVPAEAASSILKELFNITVKSIEVNLFFLFNFSNIRSKFS